MTLTLTFFVLAERTRHGAGCSRPAMYVTVGLGVLTKGPVAALIPLLVFATYLGDPPRAGPAARR